MYYINKEKKVNKLSFVTLKRFENDCIILTKWTYKNSSLVEEKGKINNVLYYF